MTRPSARHVLPELTEHTASGNRTMDPYSKLLEERIVILGTQIDETSANDVMAQFMYLEHHSPDRDISLYVNSPGGSFHAMSAIYDTLRYVSCDVETIEGQTSDLAIQSEELTRIRSRMEEILVRHTGRTAEQVRADIERDKVLDAQAAVEYGLADRIVPSRRSASPASGAR